MPLPKPPAQRAAMVSPADFEVKAARTGRKPKARPAVEAPAALSTATSLDAAAGNGEVQTRPAPATTEVPLLPPPEPKARKPRRPTGDERPRLFVLDTNVLMHDPMSLFRFDEHDVYVPMITLEELDNHKRGMSEVARNARQVSRELDALATDTFALDAKAGITLDKTGHREATGKLFFQTQLIDVQLPIGLPQGKADNQILGVVQSLREQYAGKRDVVLVSKDINMRI
ncbi:MAG TPA: PIN domain-containing protein, partial [Burkholderiaceae bacterium]|nr:PIN domain-containing protein [Burkholderiaceae bacterium]